MPSSITIEGISNNLTGYGFLEGKKYQFSYASIGDVLQFETLGRGKRKYNKVLTRDSSHDYEPNCEYFTKCGGCKARHIPYPDQFKYKTDGLYRFYLENFNIELPREEERRLAVQYGSVQLGLNREFGIYTFNQRKFLRKITTFRSTKYGFLKPFLEKKQYLKIPGEAVLLQKYSYQNRPNITDVFPTLNDFFKFVQENPKSFKVTTTRIYLSL